jgi:hypothetical protein
VSALVVPIATNFDGYGGIVDKQECALHGENSADPDSRIGTTQAQARRSVEARAAVLLRLATSHGPSESTIDGCCLDCNLHQITEVHSRHADKCIERVAEKVGAGCCGPSGGARDSAGVFS